MADPLPFFVALLPTSRLAEEILDRKKRVHSCAGEQLFLSHPPHVTAYLAYGKDRFALQQRLAQLATVLPPLALKLEGWHVFFNDCLTGNHTLVCKIADVDKTELRQYQAKIVEALRPNVDLSACLARYRTTWETLSPERRLAVEQVGFPFIGADWQPHFTIASIRPQAWDKVWTELEGEPIWGTFSPLELACFDLVDGDPVLAQRHSLEGPAAGPPM